MMYNWEAWCRKADSSLRAAKVLAEIKEWDGACYHLQQSAEKYMKAIVVGYGGKPETTSSLVFLSGVLMGIGCNIQDSIIKACETLEGKDTQFQYPGVDATEEDYVRCKEAFDVLDEFCGKALDSRSNSADVIYVY